MFSSLGQSGHKNWEYANLQFSSQKIPSYLRLWLSLCLIWPSYTVAWNKNSIKKTNWRRLWKNMPDKQTRHRFLPLQQLVPQQSSEEDHAPLTIERGTEDPTTFFKVHSLPSVANSSFAPTQDGKRKIDFVLVFEVIHQLGSRFLRSSHFIRKISTQKGG